MDTQENPDSLLKKAQKKAKKKALKEISYERTRVAFEKLQLAWLRAALTFIALGFAGYKFYFARMQEGNPPLLQYLNGREIGLFLIVAGFFGLLQATIKHRKNLAKLRKYYQGMPYSVSLVQSYFILGLALLLLLAVIYRL